MEKLRKEVADFEFTDDTMIIERLSKLKYLDKVLKESQRLYPVIMMLGRICFEPVSILGHYFEKGTRFKCLTSKIHW